MLRSGVVMTLAAVVSLSGCNSTRGSAGTKVRVLEAGEARVRVTRKVGAPETALGTVDEVDRGGTEIVEGGTSLAARVGSAFGMRVEVDGPGGSVVPLRTRVTHPPITNPSTSKTTTVDEWASPMSAKVPTYVGWGFSEPWELAAGMWRIEILFEGRPVAGESFAIRLATER